jgi:transcriptional regulator with XRE-family HTH domain
MLNFSLTTTPSDVLQTLAKRHQVLRKKIGYSQQELADRSGVSLGSIKRFERTGLISLESLLKLAHVLNRLEDFDKVLENQNNLDDIEKLFSDKTR